MKATALLFGFALAACQPSASAPAPNVESVAAASNAFAQYRTFAFGLAEEPPAPYAVSQRSFEVERRMHVLILTELTKKGYVLSDKGDFVVKFSAGNVKERAHRSIEPDPAEQSAEYVHLGQLAIDAFDGSSHTQVWHGTAEAQINPQQIDDQLLQTAVQRMMASFPGRPSDRPASGAAESQAH